MRGCVPAGMAAAMSHPNLALMDCIDCVYGSSAGAVTAAYTVARQPEGMSVFYDALSAETGLGKDFIDPMRCLRPLAGLPPNVPLAGFPPNGPALDLSRLLSVISEGPLALDFDQLLRQDATQPLRILASSPTRSRAEVLSRERGSWRTMPELLECLRASALVPGVCGSTPVNLATATQRGGFMSRLVDRLRSLRSHTNDRKAAEHLLMDALFFEPLPYRSALRDGCTHVLVLRALRDGTLVSPTRGFFDVNLEEMLFKGFAQSNGLDDMLAYVKDRGHARIYAEDMLRLNEETARLEADSSVDSRWLSARRHLQLRQLLPPCIMAVALQPSDPAVASLELRRARLLSALKVGFARAYAALAEDPKERCFERGMEEARQILPDS